ncbi:MAG: glycosyltransferase [Nitrospinae bacterium]|nr:glycosyltransferase [Nitrospinota bacterium]
MTYPKISIVIPAYNHEAYLETAVLSAISQTYKLTEIILLNDGSTDSTGDICEKFSAMHPSIRYYSHSNMGAYNTINKGIKLASGQFIAILNSDDIFYPEKIERCVELVCKKKTLELISGNVEFIDSKGASQTKGISTEWQERGYSFYEATGLLPLSILNENFITTTSNMFFTKEIWQKVGGFQALRYCHDLDFLMASYRTGAHYFDKEFSHIKYRVHEANTIKEDISKITKRMSRK